VCEFLSFNVLKEKLSFFELKNLILDLKEYVKLYYDKQYVTMGTQVLDNIVITLH